MDEGAMLTQNEDGEWEKIRWHIRCGYSLRFKRRPAEGSRNAKK